MFWKRWIYFIIFLKFNVRIFHFHSLFYGGGGGVKTFSVYNSWVEMNKGIVKVCSHATLNIKYLYFLNYWPDNKNLIVKTYKNKSNNVIIIVFRNIKLW